MRRVENILSSTQNQLNQLAIFSGGKCEIKKNLARLLNPKYRNCFRFLFTPINDLKVFYFKKGWKNLGFSKHFENIVSFLKLPREKKDPHNI